MKKLRINWNETKDIGIVTHYKGDPFTGICYDLHENGNLYEELEMLNKRINEKCCPDNNQEKLLESAYPCVSCGKEFPIKYTMIKHMKTEHATKKKCRICNDSFQNNFKLEEHLIHFQNMKKADTKDLLKHKIIKSFKLTEETVF